MEILQKRQKEFFDRRASSVTFKLIQEEYMEHERCSAYFLKKMKAREDIDTIVELEREEEGKIVRERWIYWRLGENK